MNSYDFKVCGIILKELIVKKIIVAETNMKRNIQHDSYTLWNCFKKNYEKGLRTVASRSLENKNNLHGNTRYTSFFFLISQKYSVSTQKYELVNDGEPKEKHI